MAVGKSFYEKGSYWDEKSRAIDKKANAQAEGFKEGVGITDRKSGEIAKDQVAANTRQAGESSGVYDQMTRNEQQYQTSRDPYVDTYVQQQEELRDQSKSQSTDARETYSNTIQPELKNLMETNKQNAAGAMTLQQSMDPNNRVASGVRNMYNQQAQGTGQAGLAASGVLANLGAQAFGNQMGAGNPMTGSQMQLMGAQSQQQGADAYARTQQRMQALQEQGIDRGFQETDKAYGRGLQAQDRLRGSIGDIEGAEDRFHQGQAGFRGEQGMLGADIMGMQVGRAGQDLGFAQGQSERDLAGINQRYGNEGALRTANMNRSAAGQAGKLGMTTGAITGALTAVGAAYGGPQGAQMGNQAGQGIAQGAQGSASRHQGVQSYQGPPMQNYMPNEGPRPYGQGNTGYAQR